jgi:molybdate transport system ATP-binding protein
MNTRGPLPDLHAAYSGHVGAFALDVDFTVPARGITALFGPSGCGKTTILRCIAGLQSLAGLFRLGGETWQDGTRSLPPHRRPVGYVFQEASLFPHLSVRRNLLFGKNRAGLPAGRPEVWLDEVVALLGLTRLLERSPRHLSGGERQRVAIGRALLSQPALLLMDEPLSALDRASKDEILPFLERLHEVLSIPMLYVTHDMAEVERLADHLVLLENGRVLGAGPLGSLQSNPSLPLLRSREAAVTLDAVTAGYDARYGLLSLDVDGATFLAPAPAPVAAGMTRRLRVAAGDVSVATVRPEGTSMTNVLPCRIETLTDGGPAEAIAVLRLGEAGDGARLLARLTRRSVDQLGLTPGRFVHAQVKGVALVPARRDDN